MSFEDDCRDAPFIRPAARIRIFGPEGELLDVIEIPELAIEPDPTEQQQATLEGEQRNFR